MQNRHDTTAGKCLDGYPGENGIQLGAVDIVLSHCYRFFCEVNRIFFSDYVEKSDCRWDIPCPQSRVFPDRLNRRLAGADDASL